MPVNVPAQEEVRGGHPCFLSPGKGQWRVFTEDQKARVVDYRLYEFDGKSLSSCARKCNLRTNTLISRTSEHDSQQTCPDTTGVAEGSPEATASHPVEFPLHDVSW
ncbi:MAG: hypothetical protein OXF02_00600 [Simkaniaceae bacterium]|nr:hypothetical protein [Simkaniaceae bacterium]